MSCSSCRCTAQQSTANTAQERLRANKHLRNNQEITSCLGAANMTESVTQFWRRSYSAFCYLRDIGFRLKIIAICKIWGRQRHSTDCLHVKRHRVFLFYAEWKRANLTQCGNKCQGSRWHQAEALPAALRAKPCDNSSLPDSSKLSSSYLCESLG